MNDTEAMMTGEAICADAWCHDPASSHRERDGFCTEYKRRSSARPAPEGIYDEDTGECLCAGFIARA